ncbi:caspase-6-like [Uranotaenia lowii]|uniref:caspase-6-like n=1 Tax=Uranotaenia lowii TaxID=190385 RepID=UPI00247979DA|nr:caspase-6-like [Uranotaenia lowii]
MMGNGKSAKASTSYSSSSKATTSNAVSTTSTKSYISPYRRHSETATSSINKYSFASTSSSKYQSVYPSHSAIVRDAIPYKSLQYRPSPPSYSAAALQTTSTKLLKPSMKRDPFGATSVVGSLMNNPYTASIPVPSSSGTSNLNSNGNKPEPSYRATAQNYSGATSRIGSTSTSAPIRYNLRDKAFVLIFHHKMFGDKKLLRMGSEKDLERLKQFFKKYRVDTMKICDNYTVQQVKKKMIEIKQKRLAHISCLIVVIMSHGDTHGRIHAYDGIYNLEHDVVEQTLLNETLKDKPKLFFVQACKGNALMETDAFPTTTNKNDILKCYSTYEGTVSLRDPKTGTYFIQQLFDLIEKHPENDINELMIILRNQFSSDRISQTPTDTSTLTKKFFFADLKK